MPQATDGIMTRITDLQAKILKSESSIVERYLLIGEGLQELKECAIKGEFGKLITKLGYNGRVASRHMALAHSWWKENGLKESGLIGELPTDLLKLEMICRLSLEQLKKFLEEGDPRVESRGAVSKRVQKMLGIQPKNSIPKRSVIEKISTQFGQTVNRILGQLKEYPEELSVNEQRRQSLLKQIREKFDVLEKALTRPSVPDKDTAASSADSQRSVEPQKTSPSSPVPSSKPTTTSTLPTSAPKLVNAQTKRVPILTGKRS